MCSRDTVVEAAKRCPNEPCSGGRARARSCPLVNYRASAEGFLREIHEVAGHRASAKQTLSLATGAGASGSLLAACGGSDDSGGGSDASETTASADCSDLSDAQKQQREQMVNSLNYVEESPEPDRTRTVRTARCTKKSDTAPAVGAVNPSPAPTRSWIGWGGCMSQSHHQDAVP